MSQKLKYCKKKKNVSVFLLFIDFETSGPMKKQKFVEAYFRQNGKPFYVVTSCHEMR